MVRGFAILFVCQLVGVLFSWLTPLPIPGSVLGMVLLLLTLIFGLIKLEWVEEAAELLLKYLALFFVPAGVGVMTYKSILGDEWLPITVATVISTFVVMAITGFIAERLETREPDGVE